MPWLTRGLRNGVVTTRYPRRPDPYAAAFPAAVSPCIPADGSDGEPLSSREAQELPRLCPTGAISVTGGQASVDRGRCVLCGRCVRARPDRFAWRPGTETARDSRTGLVVPEVPETDEALTALREDLARRTRALRRSVHIRHVDAGSDGAEEWEVLALLNPVYDIHRLGFFLTASPRHADVLLVTGAGAHGMAAPLARTLEAMARPIVTIAAGVDAVSGGIIAPSYAVAGGLDGLLSVDVWVPGSPPSPFSLLHALLLATGRLTAAGPDSATGGITSRAGR